MAVIQATTATTLNPSPDRKEAVGKNTKWNGKLSGRPPAPPRRHSERLEFEASLALRAFQGRKEVRNKPSVQALCPEYQKLLKEEQVALSNWTRGRAEIHESIRQGRDTHNELQTLHAGFSNAWALLQFHELDCDVCQLIALLDDGHTGPNAATLQQVRN